MVRFLFSIGMAIAISLMFVPWETSSFLINNKHSTSFLFRKMPSTFLRNIHHHHHRRRDSTCTGIRWPLFIVADAEEIYYKNQRRNSSGKNNTRTSSADFNNNNNNIVEENYNEDDVHKILNDQRYRDASWIPTASGGFLPNLSPVQQQRFTNAASTTIDDDTYSSSLWSTSSPKSSISSSSASDADQVLNRKTNQHLEKFNPSIHMTSSHTSENQLKQPESPTSSKVKRPLNNNSKSNPTTSDGKKVIEVLSLEEYKRVVVDETNCIVVVRFHASWCRACQAIATYYRNQLPLKFPRIKFVEVPLTKENAYIHQQLGVPSLPYAHIYYPNVGLVEEVKIGRKVFSDFVKLLRTYDNGYCTVVDNEQSNNDDK